MHMAFLDRVEKMEWVRARHVNMQNFSLTVALPVPQLITGPADVIGALSSLSTYCALFAAAEVVGLVQRLHALTLEEIGSGTWANSDLLHFVYWIDSVLEQFRSVATNDLAGGSSRHTIVATVTQQSLALDTPDGSCPPAARFNRTKGGRRLKADRPLQLPKKGERELCLRSLSRRGCQGIVEAPSQYIYPDYDHFTPAQLSDEALTFNQQRLGGISPEFKQL
ncbi:hypothetical protein PHMEG_00027207 [Phytophthora megakarya]|uniref:Uncharacterized protein n=1 Tax=Phytophthora megakarya TaxID=4795 RepID=A0A225VAD8_9STRA|nr:hypothetical protein PHMEG_00027207 [Phytophthora megakarya]